jgi:hypothetical protein
MCPPLPRLKFVRDNFMAHKVATMPRVIIGVCYCLGFGVSAFSQKHPTQPSAAKKEKAMPTHAGGPFDVKLTPQSSGDSAEDAILGRMTIDKQFHGDLEATSKGQMLTGMTSVKGSAGYVAIERVTGTLKGRKGSFILQHSGTMNRGEPTLSVTVVPDSGTDELKGLSGKMSIKIEQGKHSYDFEYTLE